MNRFPWAGLGRATAPAAVGGLVVAGPRGGALTVAVAACWYLLWSFCEERFDPRFGVLLGYGKWRRRVFPKRLALLPSTARATEVIDVGTILPAPRRLKRI